MSSLGLLLAVHKARLTGVDSAVFFSLEANDKHGLQQ